MRRCALRAAPILYTLRLAFGQTLSTVIISIVPSILFVLVCCGIWRYDLLTSTFAAATATLFIVNSTVMWLLEDLGNATQVGLFMAWAAVAMAAAFVAFRAELVAAWQRTTAAMS